MRGRAPLIAFLIMLAGCGVQQGLFSTTGTTGQPLSPYPGYIEIVSGCASRPFNRTNAPEQNLLYLLVVFPGTEAHLSGSSVDFGRYVTKLTDNWATQTGQVTITLQWDRRKDTVSVGKWTFPRGQGNVIVVRREPAGALMAQQVPSLAPHADCTDVLRHVQQRLPKDQVLASLKLQDIR